MSSILKSLFTSYVQTNSSITLSSTPQQVITKLISVINQNEMFVDSKFYQVYLKIYLSLNNTKLQQLFTQDFLAIRNKIEQIDKYTTFDYILEEVKEQIIDCQRVGYYFVQHWCNFFIIETNKIISQQSKREIISLSVKQLFHKQFYLLTEFINYLEKKIFKDALEQFKMRQNKYRSLLSHVRNSITQCDAFKKVHHQILMNVSTVQIEFNDTDRQQNEHELEKMLSISNVPIPFLSSKDKIQQFYRQHSFLKKIKLIQQLEEQLYNDIKAMNIKRHIQVSHETKLICLSYIMEKVSKNICGACEYIDLVICFKEKEVNEEIVEKQLEEKYPKISHFYKYLKYSSRIRNRHSV